MEVARIILFAIAAVFYVRTWKYIRQLVKETNEQRVEKRFTALNWWPEAWRLHSQLYPISSVRKYIAWNIALTVTFMLGMMFVQVRSYILTHP